MKFNYNKLKGKIIEHFGSFSAFAEETNISRTTLSKKLNNKSEFSQQEISLMASKLSISDKDIQKYFFIKEVKNGTLFTSKEMEKN